MDVYIRPFGSSFYHPASRSANAEYGVNSPVDAGMLMFAYDSTFIRAWCIDVQCARLVTVHSQCAPVRTGSAFLLLSRIDVMCTSVLPLQ